jgi:hypothetical protein
MKHFEQEEIIMTKITQEQLTKILASHGKWWRDEEGGQRAYLQGADLQCANLRDADLRDAYLRDADLQGADLRGADLQCANLRDADLRDAYLRDADLRGAYLQGADLQCANLQGADLPTGVYQIVGCGSVNRCTTYDSINDCVICGCWNDNAGNHLAAFRNRIETIYGVGGSDEDERYYREYMAAVVFFETIKEGTII